MTVNFKTLVSVICKKLVKFIVRFSVDAYIGFWRTFKVVQQPKWFDHGSIPGTTWAKPLSIIQEVLPKKIAIMNH